ncbi:MAG TPA: PilC/PilY family type IV pilus protein [Methylobacter sp.]|jgi:type IV pilus assembly protein PilY1
MYQTAKYKTRSIWLLAMFAYGISWSTTPAWAGGFTPVTQCFRDTGAPGWIMQLYDNGTKNSKVPLTAASNTDTAGSGWLRLTDNNGNKSGSAYYNLPINVTQLGIQAQFSYTAWGGTGADGISLYLFDGSTIAANFKQGVFGGGLGYCQQTNYGGVTLDGLSNAVVGVGIDDWGNFANDVDRCPNYGENGRKNTPYGSIAVRGPGNGQYGYKWLADNISLPTTTPTWYQSSTSTRPTASQFFRNVQVNISPTTVGNTSSYTVKTSWQTTQNGAYTQLLSAPYPAGNTAPQTNNNGKFFTLPTTAGDIWNPLPPTVKFGFGASTGGSTNYHEIQDAYFTEGLPDLAITQNVASASGGMGTFQVTVTNLGSTTATNATFSATFSGLTNVLWSCTPSAGSSCPATNGSGAPSNVNFSLGIVGNVTFTFKGQAAAGTIITDTVSIAGPSGFNDADSTSNTSTTSMTIGSSPTHLNLSQLPQTSDSAADNTVTGGQVKTSTQVYIAQYHPANWWGELLAYSLVTSGTGSSAKLTGLSSLPIWNASCVLTGGSCNLTTGTTTFTAQTPSSRAILTWNGTTGIPFVWANLNSTQQTALTTDPAFTSSSFTCNNNLACVGDDAVDFLRGGRTNEQGDSTPGPFRTRTGILGDIVDSNPVFVGQPTANYPVAAPWSDLLYSSSTMPENASTNSYAAYQTAQATRRNVTYIASNDGMLHGFSSGNYDSSGNYVSTYNNGTELMAYMPSTVLSTIAQNSATAFATNYNFTDPAYTHHFFVNASPSTGDLYYNSAWHTWLVGGLGGGGSAIYALDITNPANFSQSNAASLVVKELNTSNLTCSNITSCANDLGSTYGTPIIRRMHNGTWAVIFGNGYNSANGYASVFIATINSSSGAWTVYELQTNLSLIPNGINYVTSSDLDGDNVTDYLYAGDLFGNVWRFDVTSSNPSNWQVSKFGGTSAQPLFTAANSTGIAQPIATAVQVQTIKQNGLSRIIIMFGTGKNLEAADLLPDNTTHGVQSIYGVWDWDMTAWNAISSKQFASLTAPQTITRSVLQQQTVTGTFDGSGNAFTSSSTTGYRTLSGTTVCWAGSTACSSNNQLGFYLDLPSLGEEVLYNPLIVNGLFIVNTTIPSPQTKGMTCYPPLPPGGWTMAINPLNGGVILTGGSVFTDSSNNFTKINGSPVSGMYVSAVGTPSEVVYNNATYLLNKTSSGNVVVQQVQSNVGSTPPIGHRLSWVELR